MKIYKHKISGQNIALYSKQEVFIKINDLSKGLFLKHLEKNPPISDNSDNSEFSTFLTILGLIFI